MDTHGHQGAAGAVRESPDGLPPTHHQFPGPTLRVPTTSSLEPRMSTTSLDHKLGANSLHKLWQKLARELSPSGFVP